MKPKHYEAFIDSVDHIYDGDTVNHVHIKLGELQPGWVDPDASGELFPEVFITDHALWIHTAVRLLGIDCPEFHPHHRLPDGTERDINDIMWEHERATEARDEVRRIIIANDLRFTVRNPMEGKYAGRIVAEIWVPDPEHGQLINVSKRLLTKNLAYEYDGGTKQIWTRPKS